MIVGWGILSPLSKSAGWAPGPVGDMTTGARGWILWTSLAIMMTDSLVSLVPVLYGTVVKYSSGIRKSAQFRQPSEDGAAVDDGLQVDVEAEETEQPERLVPLSWVLWGSGGSVIAGTFLVWLVFGQEGIRLWASLLGYVLGGVLSVLGCVSTFLGSLRHR